jgi:hypothetical protein
MTLIGLANSSSTFIEASSTLSTVVLKPHTHTSPWQLCLIYASSSRRLDTIDIPKNGANIIGWTQLCGCPHPGILDPERPERGHFVTGSGRHK